MRRFGDAVLLAALWQLILVADAHAYLDPGTGSFIVQTIIAMVVGATFTLKVYWRRLKGFLSGKPERPAEAGAEAEKDHASVG